MSLEEFRENLKNPDLEEKFYEEVGNRFNIRDRSTMSVIRFMLNDVVVQGRMNDWCLLKSLYSRAKLKTSLNEFYYSIIPKLVALGFLEMKVLISPQGKIQRGVRLSENFVSETLSVIMSTLKNSEKTD